MAVSKSIGKIPQPPNVGCATPVLGQKRRRPKTPMAKNADSQKRRRPKTPTAKNADSKMSLPGTPIFRTKTPIYINFTFSSESLNCRVWFRILRKSRFQSRDYVNRRNVHSSGSDSWAVKGCNSSQKVMDSIPGGCIQKKLFQKWGPIPMRTFRRLT